MIDSLAIGKFFASITPKGWLVIGVAAALVAAVAAVVIISDNRDKRLVETAEGAGAADAVITGQNRTLDQLGDANDAEANLRAGGERNADRFNQCLQDSRRPEACERYRPRAE